MLSFVRLSRYGHAVEAAPWRLCTTNAEKLRWCCGQHADLAQLVGPLRERPCRHTTSKRNELPPSHRLSHPYRRERTIRYPHKAPSQLLHRNRR
jgi:hypothetical protein